jgi:putative pyruvate formate lyase activating enzyme
MEQLQYAPCRLCPRQCGVDRTRGERGVCRQPAEVRVARAAPHFWEEPPISGSFGSGTVFFSGCTLGCVFCQNRQISQEDFGAAVSRARLREIFESLVDEGCHNINLVTPTQFLPDIVAALTPKLPVPVVMNSGGYESVETLWALEGLIDIYLPDFKYADGALAGRLAGASDYPTVAKAAIQEMYRQTGPAQYDAEGVMTRGVLLRHLVLPGQVENSLAVVDWVSETFPKGAVPFSLMCQYTPMPGLESPLDRRVTEEEYAAVQSWMTLCGMEDGFWQDYAAATEAYIPSFQLEGVEEAHK